MYNDLYEALDDLSTDQIKVSLRADGNHSITLDNLCDDGLAEVLRHLVNEMGLSSDQVLEMVPQLKKLSVTDLLTAALSGDSLNLEDLLENLPSSSKVVSASDQPRVGDVYTTTRKVTNVDSWGNLTYEDENGKQSTIQKSSFKSWAKNKRKS